MRRDIDEALRGWPYDPDLDEIEAREVRAGRRGLWRYRNECTRNGGGLATPWKVLRRFPLRPAAAFRLTNEVERT
jgi:hypothetical protein